MLGRVEPRIGTPRREDLPTHGPLLRAFDDLFGFELMEWQNLVADRALEYHPTRNGWRWAHQTVGVMAARQTAKTTTAERRILAGLFVLGDRTIIHLAQDRTLPRESFELLGTLISDTPSLNRHLAKRGGLRFTNGQERIKLKDGSQYAIVAPTEKAVRGWKQVGLVVVDEVRTYTSRAVWSAVQYCQRAHPNPQRWALSNAGHADSVILNELQARGHKAAANPDADPTMCWLEWSATREMDRSDPATWAWATPSLGITITEAAILEELRNEDTEPELFDAEALCIPQESLSANAIPWDKWVAAGDPDLPSIAEGSPTWAAFDIDPEREWGAIVLGAWVDERLVVALHRLWPGEDGAGADEVTVADELEDLWRRWSVRSIGYDPHTGGGVVDRLEGLPFDPVTGADWIVACGQLLDAAKTPTLTHPDQSELNAQMAAAGRRDVGDGSWTISRRTSSQPIPAPIALARLVHVAIAGSAAVGSSVDVF